MLSYDLWQRRFGSDPDIIGRKYWPGQNPVGQRLLSSGPGKPITFTVVGLVIDVKHAGLETGGLAEPDVYVPLYPEA